MTAPVDVREFYRSRLGRRTRDILALHVDRLWPPALGARIAALGLGAELLPPQTEVSVCATSSEKGRFSFLVDAQKHRVPDNSFDRLIVFHAAQKTLDVEFLLRETWRVLRGEGRLLVIMPRQHSAWARYPYTPFGIEPAFTANQIKRYLAYQGFMVERVDRALYAPARESWTDNFALGVERVAPFLHIGGGVLLLDARKRVFGPIGKKQEVRRDNPLLPFPMPV